MSDADVGLMLRDAMVVLLKLSGPPLGVALVVGLAVALLQAVTQINEATLAFVPKALALAAAFMLFGSFMFATLASFANTLFDQIVAIGGT